MHDLSRIQRDLQESLSLDKHPVAILIGAGCPAAVRTPDGSEGGAPLIPDVLGLTQHVKAELSKNEVFKIICEQFEEDDNAEATIEDMLSRVRLLSRVVGKGNVRGLSHDQLLSIEQLICGEISKVVHKELPGDGTAYHQFVEWIGAIARSKPLQIFTTNYDLLMEQALESRRTPYFDGFIGARTPFFDLRAIEDDQAPLRWVRLWKLHGSVNWKYSKSGGVVRRFPVPTGSEGVLIHPSELKYDESRRMPYLAMMDRLRHFLKQPSAFLVTIGYSFADDHLNEVIIQGVRGNPTAASYALFFKELEKERAANRVSGSLPTNLTFVAKDAGVVRGTRGPWANLQDEPTGTTPTTTTLGDFGTFAAFVRSLAPGTGGAS